ncbi:MAG TPA: transglycosylase domain-containing protein [Candidatus Mediterraneibacter stercorigallinarum]|uniref:Penicillin-binding protein 1A n=1 Tax=Candidatus Mediterraneibacter stercorigallinarum TaxID=2838686 RepID=A0A9D2DBF3_9FIRM|nr:transglycosylase domain-containing protein [Candidatus Mediterraneibacter stercorigallinarum]
MNYGKDNLSRRKKTISSKKRKKQKRVGVRFFKAIIICILLLVVICVIGGVIFAKKIIDDTQTVSADDILPKGFTTTITDQNGTVIDTLKDSDSNRVYRTYEEITANSDFLPHAFVAIEDERFYEHNGIDIQGIIRAGLVGIANGFDFTEGASTLTQQLIKNNIFPDFVNEKTLIDRVERKLQEQYLALEFEKEMSKEEILEAYMNTINLGQGCLGVQTASTRYFNKDVADLTLSECAVIAAITQNPTLYDPVTNPDENASRREDVLDKMLEQGYIDQAQYDEAIADPVYDRILQTAAVTEDTTPYSYFTDAMIEDIIQDFINELGYTETQAYNLLYSGGLTIKSTQDLSIQQICDEVVADESLYPMTEYGVEYALTIHRADGTMENYSKQTLGTYISNTYADSNPLVFSSEEEARAMVEEYKGTLGINTEAGDIVDENLSITLQPQTSVVVMDQYTGQVKAIVGGRGQKTTSLSLNRATDSTRQPGSCFKVLSTYAPGLNECGMTLATTIKDEPYRYASGQQVNNWDGRYIGEARVRYAIEHSMNVCAVRTLTETVGLEKGYQYLQKFGFTTLVNNDPDYPGMTDVAQSTALGGITRGVYNIEMTAAYAAIANGGVYTEPILYTEILDHDGNVLIDNTTPDTHEVIKESTAYLLTSAMEDVISRGTGTSARLSNMAVAGKTGTTENSTDLWLSAYTPYYTASVWGGYDENKHMENMSQSWHMVIWRNIMERIHSELEYKDFTVPSSVVQRTICTQTGKLAVDGCPALTEYFDKDTVVKESCSGHGYVDSEEPDDETDENTDSSNGDSTTTPGTPSGGNSGSDNTGGGNTGSGDNTGGNTGGGNTGSGDNTGGGNTGGGSEETQPPAS